MNSHGMNELSPRKVPRSPIAPPKTPPRWKKPDEVMRLHRLRQRQQALNTRLNSPKAPRFSSPTTAFPAISSQPAVKRKNPFKINEHSRNEKKTREEPLNTERSIYTLLGIPGPSCSDDSLHINNLLRKLEEDSFAQAPPEEVGKKTIPVDWSVRTKMRFMAREQFPWSQTPKTCEEASGLTGFVRCVQSGSGGLIGLDTSPNAVFHQCCLYWHHPSLPWLQLFPRGYLKVTEGKQLPSLGFNQKAKESLHRDWTESFRSLFQLVRTRHCPYFYMFANSFTCVFRAAGINGSPQTNVMISPTTVGFRQQLKNEDIEFTMPLKKKDSGRRSSENAKEDVEIDLDVEEDEDGNAETTQWLASLGVEEEEIKRISISQETIEISSKKKIDNNYESLIVIEGVETQTLFNFLINCKSVIPTSGYLAGVPPTLIAPVAFSGATLASLKVRESLVKVDSDSFHSLEIRGPILPHTILNLTSILKDYLDTFSVTFATVEHTKAFSKAIQVKGKNDKETENEKIVPDPAFGVESLSDCGLQLETLTCFCTQDVRLYDSIKCLNQLYNCD